MKMKKEILLAIAFSAAMPILFTLLAIVVLGWTSFGFSVSPLGLVVEWGLQGLS